MTSTHPSQDLSREPAPVNAGDPSMEDILASIRRILSEDEPAAQAPPVEHDAQDGDVLMLDASMMLPDSIPDTMNDQPAHDEPAHDEPAHDVPAHVPAALRGLTPEPVPVAAPPAPPQYDRSLEAALVAPAAAAAAASSVSVLVRSLAAERSTQVYSGGPTLEDIVRAELRPLLKQWLDENLPPMVERLVRSELERVVGRALS